MHYVTRTEIEALLPGNFLDEGLDDTNDGTKNEEILDAVCGVIDAEINGLIAPVAALPLSVPYPDVVRSAALVLALDAVYRRRGFADEANPWASRARDARETLASIGRGEIAMDTEAVAIAAFAGSELIFHTI